MGNLLMKNRPTHSLKRRLRIRTLQCGTAQNINEIYDSVDPEVVLSILVHKVILASLEQGVREGRMLLRDWLIILTAQYNEAYQILKFNGSSIHNQIDVGFLQCQQLQHLPRLVFALLRNPLLRFHEEGVHPDDRIYLQCLFRAYNNWKALLAAKIKNHDNPHDALKDRDTGIEEIDSQWWVEYVHSPEYQVVSKRNAVNRAKKPYIHRAGSRPFVFHQVSYSQVAGSAVGFLELFERTHYSETDDWLMKLQKNNGSIKSRIAIKFMYI